MADVIETSTQGPLGRIASFSPDWDIPCGIWVADTQLCSNIGEPVLVAAERTRRASFRDAADRTRFEIGAGLLRSVAAILVGVDPGAVVVDRTCPTCGGQHGKPYIQNSGLHVSVSHSGTLVVVATTFAGAVGVDVEQVRSADISSLATRVCAPGESISGPAEFYPLWCRKEAVAKATGEGLVVPFSEVVVRPMTEQAGLEAYRGRPIACAMADLEVKTGYAGAVAVLAPGRLELRIHDGREVLLGRPG
ncbi:4'-phosphopantetheinyl transferase family protein [Jatrophihabitans lederbergiae]|uniref:4'-phosphopantetheinyl transferase superfamily protein n=1 Tax=Jatrophihabitans lederbergiae TaxID=3075547 RepID=A0ABU2JEM6_9ACTN|nr:4'-phosphopantetheinyl transferase superfamily protein [Jatrophihabitans sp. DSM 44399]MDT0263435.1 4'-phosphopantetheinyl transferase superfamily protein [Jatrophihabitans sp. DSM 44399]